MSLHLPLSDHAAAEHVDVHALADWRSLPDFRTALRATRRYVASTPGVAAAHFQALRADGSIWLVRVGRRGGWRKVWDFGDPLKAFGGGRLA